MKPLSFETEWTQPHFRWLEMVKFAQSAQQIVLQAYVDKVIACGKVARAVAAFPNPATATYGGCWSKRPGRTGLPRARQRSCNSGPSVRGK
jgi:hypothetical protein